MFSTGNPCEKNRRILSGIRCPKALCLRDRNLINYKRKRSYSEFKRVSIETYILNSLHCAKRYENGQILTVSLIVQFIPVVITVATHTSRNACLRAHSDKRKAVSADVCKGDSWESWLLKRKNADQLAMRIVIVCRAIMIIIITTMKYLVRNLHIWKSIFFEMFLIMW